MADKADRAEREARLKAALRDNLKRRKAASRKTRPSEQTEKAKTPSESSD